METGIIVAVMAVIVVAAGIYGISQETNFYTWHNFIGRILCRNVKLFHIIYMIVSVVSTTIQLRLKCRGDILIF